MIPEGEKHKTLQQAIECWEMLAREDYDRNTLILAFGGGIISDLAGFVAGCYMRGVDSVYIPTTLLAMVDASIGGKTGVNLGMHKNYVGLHYSPKKIFIDVSLLASLPEKEYIAGFAEIIKAGMIASQGFFLSIDREWDKLAVRKEEPLRQVIQQAIEIKEQIVNLDPFDRGVRSHLNFGHTFGHALESMTSYEFFLHGEAVSIGMNCAARLAKHLQFCQKETAEPLEALCKKVGLPVHFPPMDPELVIQSMKKDKKNTKGLINLILPKKIGQVEKISCNDPDAILFSLKI
jgi:3-dehydroquinate synthase